ncbi:hypothetical protein ACU4GD_06125 [Cupriavidus basilensis]
MFAGYRWMRDDGTASATAAVTRRTMCTGLGAQYNSPLPCSLTGRGLLHRCMQGQRRGSVDVRAESADYSLSKRTDAYLNVGYVKNKSGSTLGLNGSGTALPGANQTGATVGMRHRF